MIFSAESRFLRVLFRLSSMSMSFISETALQDHLKISYKKIHQLASFWEQKGCVKSMTRRGGITHYQITSLGLLEVDVLQNKRKQFFMLVMPLIIGLGAIILIFTLL
tara:strand:- start:3464 stop:3784 length:321 start_codon:yes stop_codon:yes gene_type:complete